MTTVPVSQNAIGWQLHRARAQAAEPYDILKKASWYERPIPQRHRFIFYFGHLEAFDWNLICRDHLGLRSLHPSFDRLFAFGIDPPSGSAPGDAASDWPAIEEVELYRTRVRAAVDANMKAVPEQLMRVAIEHRLMHAETLAYMLHALPYDSKKPQADPPSPLPEERASPAVKIPAGTAHLGRARGSGFGWDNEFDEHEVRLPAYEIDRYKVTNGDYLELVEQGVPAPHFWVKGVHGWGLRTMFREISLPLDWPVWVTHEEADRYARWRGKRLPTEAEYHRAAYGDRDPDPGRVHADFRSWNPVSVYADTGRGPFETRQMVGNGWEWTSTIFAPFKGFVPFPFYPGYSADFFDGQHWVIKGGSPRTAGCLLRRSFRNWFRGEYPYVYAGFRCVAS
jgi:formylglycine-generating enzyme required for sulfatase activity